MKTSEPYYVVITEGDGAECLIFAEQDLKQALHTRLCTCNAEWDKCETDGVKQLVESLDDDDEWTHPYPSHQRMAWGAQFEEGAVQVVRLTFADEEDMDALTGCADDQEYELSDALKRLGEDGLNRLLNKTLHK